jgi:hypothetical protein
MISAVQNRIKETTDVRYRVVRVSVVLFGGILALLSGCIWSSNTYVTEVKDVPSPPANINPILVVRYRLAEVAQAGREQTSLDESPNPEDGDDIEAPDIEILSPADGFLASAGELEEMLSSGLFAKLPGADEHPGHLDTLAASPGEAGFIRQFTRSATGDGRRNTPGGYALMALLMMREGDYQSSVRLLEKALVREPGLKAAHCLLAKSYIALGRRSRALHHVRIVLQQDPEDVWARSLMFGPAHPAKPPKKRLYCQTPSEPPSRQFSLVMPEQCFPGS